MYSIYGEMYSIYGEMYSIYGEMYYVCGKERSSLTTMFLKPIEGRETVGAKSVFCLYTVLLLQVFG